MSKFMTSVLGRHCRIGCRTGSVANCSRKTASSDIGQRSFRGLRCPPWARRLYWVRTRTIYMSRGFTARVSVVSISDKCPWNLKDVSTQSVSRLCVCLKISQRLQCSSKIAILNSTIARGIILKWESRSLVGIFVTIINTVSYQHAAPPLTYTDWISTSELLKILSHRTERVSIVASQIAIYSWLWLAVLREL